MSTNLSGFNSWKKRSERPDATEEDYVRFLKEKNEGKITSPPMMVSLPNGSLFSRESTTSNELSNICSEHVRNCID